MKKILFAVFAVSMGALVGAMEWPMPQAVLIRGFGSNNDGHPALGSAFEGEGTVAAAAAGEVVFSRSGKADASRLPSPLGAWSAVDHGDGLVSVYSRHGGESPRRGATVEQSGTIAAAGMSGWSENNGFYYIMYDRRERRFMNPSMVITPFADSVPPQITGVQLRSPNGNVLDSGQFRNLGRGAYTIIVNAVDTLSAGGIPLAPHRIICSVNGEEAGSLFFETICAREGVLLVTRGGFEPAMKVYAPFPAFEAGEVNLNRGQAIMEIIVRDIAGNSRNAVFRITVE